MNVYGLKYLLIVKTKTTVVITFFDYSREIATYFICVEVEMRVLCFHSKSVTSLAHNDAETFAKRGHRARSNHNFPFQGLELYTT